MSKQTKEFQTEVKEILDLMIHSLYSHREIFLRELISNSSDALDKVRFKEITNPELGVADKHIRLTPNKEARTLTISDNGIGMSKEELVKNLGTIAYSGSKAFAKNMKEMKDKPELIGQFGVGFYSAFMVADKVTVHSQQAGSTEGAIWESTGDGSFTIEDQAREDGAGTTMTLHLKEFKDEENPQDFCDEWTLRSIIKKYSDFISYPIKTLTTRSEPELDSEGKPVEGKTKTTTADETLNSQKALWLKAAKDVTDEEYNEFYKHLTTDWNAPLSRIHYKAEGTQEFNALIFVPGMVPFDYNQRDMKYGLSLYVKRVFITGDCEQLVPQYLRFLKGVVDSSDLPLNVSRELIQKDRQILSIQKAVVGKVLRHFAQLLKNKRSEYIEVYKNFGSTLKEGVASDQSNQEKLLDLQLYFSTHSEEYTTLAEYKERMPAEQKEIFFITGEELEQLKNSPYLEKLKKKNFEVLLMTDPVDEWVMSNGLEYQSNKFVSIANENLDVDTATEKEANKKQLEENQTKFKPLCEKMQKSLDEWVKEVKITNRLVDSPVCLVSGAQDMSSQMERMMEKMGQAMPKSKKIMEINPDHPIFLKMMDFTDDKQALWSEILYSQALLTEGSQIKDPMKFSQQICDLMSSQS